MTEYKYMEGSMHERFMNCRAPIQIFGGGFANGKTAAASVKALRIAKDYPGANILMARSTYPKLNDTLRKEFLKWIPKKWIVSFPMSANASNVCTITNGTQFNFRYVQQSGKTSAESTTSNLLSATYDLAVIDQIEDPEITEKDFNDILGRMRGNAAYMGIDHDMPRSGPGWVIITCNPTRNWVYHKLVKPLKIYQTMGVITEDLKCVRTLDGKPILDVQGKPQLLIELFEGSTYINAHNLRPDFIRLLESNYTGTMRERYLKGEWAAYEGLVYPQFSQVTHMISRTDALMYLDNIYAQGYDPQFLEGFDYGMVVPSCYMLGYTDNFGNTIVLDGFYEKEQSIPDLKKRIAQIRAKYGVPTTSMVRADPSIFRRSPGGGNVVGTPISTMFINEPHSTVMIRGNNNITTGITKIQAHLQPMDYHKHPITGDTPSPHLYFVDDMEFVSNEFGSYYWQLNTTGDRIDMPVDKNDHAMDTLKYMMTVQPELAALVRNNSQTLPAYMKWHETNTDPDGKAHRHG